jgi:hypothetical protein
LAPLVGLPVGPSASFDRVPRRGVADG